MAEVVVRGRRKVRLPTSRNASNPSNTPSRCATSRRRSRSSRRQSSRNRTRRRCAMCCATCPASASRPVKAAAVRRRLPFHPRLQRAQRPLYRRRARLRRLLARSVQLRAGRSGERAGVHLHRPRLDGRLDQFVTKTPRLEIRSIAATSASARTTYNRFTIDVNQPLRPLGEAALVAGAAGEQSP